MTSGQLSQIWGFDSRKGAVPSEDKIAAALELVNSDFLVIDEAQQKLSITRPEVKINLGGIGKGYTLDRVAELFEQQSINDFVIHGGQSSVLARGGSGEPVTDEDLDQRCWHVGLSHPTAAGVRLAQVKLRNQALGTSGTARQGFFLSRQAVRAHNRSTNRLADEPFSFNHGDLQVCRGFRCVGHCIFCNETS